MEYESCSASIYKYEEDWESVETVFESNLWRKLFNKTRLGIVADFFSNAKNNINLILLFLAAALYC